MATGAKTTDLSLLNREVDVAIVGNGPSSIALSYLLSGYRPYWNGQPHPNEYLALKLAAAPDQSILDQDLDFLAEGLTGRSENPISLLLDQLLLPDADAGFRLPPVVKWRHHKELAIDHIVLGRGCVGGSWANMPDDLQSLSYAQWLQLPDMPIVDFLRQVNNSEEDALDRGVCGVIAQYYQQYVRRKSLQARFVCGAEVTHVRRLDGSDDCKHGPSPSASSILQHCHCCVSPSASPCCQSGTSADQTSQCESPGGSLSSADLVSDQLTSRHCSCTSPSASTSNDSIASFSSSAGSYPIPRPVSLDSSSSSSVEESSSELCSPATESPAAVDSSHDYAWSIRGCRSRRPFRIRARHVVIAVGTSDEPRRLSVPGESLDILSYGCPSQGTLRSLGTAVSETRPLIVVGCGLTAADTVLLALQQGMAVVHVFGRAVSDTKLVVNRMPTSVYPEYARVGKLMQSRVGDAGKALVFDSNEPYLSLPCHHITSVTPETCSLQSSSTGQEVTVQCSHIFVAAGSRPNLSFLPQSGQNLSYEPGADFDCRVNPIDVDPVTFESSHVPDLYAMGPLVGDNFVRFAIGASLGITKSIAAKRGVKRQYSYQSQS